MKITLTYGEIKAFGFSGDLSPWIGGEGLADGDEIIFTSDELAQLGLTGLVIRKMNEALERNPVPLPLASLDWRLE